MVPLIRLLNPSWLHRWWTSLCLQGQYCLPKQCGSFIVLCCVYLFFCLGQAALLCNSQCQSVYRYSLSHSPSIFVGELYPKLGIGCAITISRNCCQCCDFKCSVSQLNLKCTFTTKHGMENSLEKKVWNLDFSSLCKPCWVWIWQHRRSKWIFLHGVC